MSLVKRISDCRVCEKALPLGPRPIVQLHPDAKKNLTETVRSWYKYGDAIMPLPHPSPRNNIWLSKNHWFEKDLVPVLQERVAKLI